MTLNSFIRAFFSMCALLFFSPLEAQWSNSVTISEAGIIMTDDPVVVDSFGNATCMWRIIKTINGTEYDIIQASTKPYGSNWEPVEDLFSPVAVPGTTEPVLVVDPAGNLTAICATSTGINEWGLQYWTKPFGGSWQGPTAIAGASMGNTSFGYKAGVDSQGNLVILWPQLNIITNTWTLNTSIKPFGSDWLAIETLTSGSNQFEEINIAFDSSDNAVATWKKAKIIYAATKSSQSNTWDLPVEIFTAGLSTYPAQIACNQSGDVLVGWTVDNFPSAYIETRMKRSGSASWEPAESIPSSALTVNDSPRITLDNTGNAVAVWEEWTGSSTTLQWSYKSAGGAWQTPMLLSATGIEANTPKTVINSSGSVTAVWREFTGSNWRVMSAYKPSTSNEWQPAIEIGISSAVSDDGGSALINAAIDPDAHITATWRHWTGLSYQIQSASYVASPEITSLSSSSGPKKGGGEVIITGSSFASAASVFFGTTEASFTVNSPSTITALVPPGSGIVDVVVVTPSGSSTSSSATKYTYLLSPPAQFKGKLIEHAFSSQVEYVHRLSWKASPDPLVTKYLIYRDGSLFKTVLAGKPRSVDVRNVRGKKRVEYRIVAQGDSGLYSDPLTISIK